MKNSVSELIDLYNSREGGNLLYNNDFSVFIHGIPAFAGMTNEGFSYIGLPPATDGYPNCGTSGRSYPALPDLENKPVPGLEQKDGK